MRLQCKQRARVADFVYSALTTGLELYAYTKYVQFTLLHNATQRMLLMAVTELYSVPCTTRAALVVAAIVLR
eukprot:16610-Heterococcus_DN1.PRE.1